MQAHSYDVTFRLAYTRMFGWFILRLIKPPIARSLDFMLEDEIGWFAS